MIGSKKRLFIILLFALFHASLFAGEQSTTEEIAFFKDKAKTMSSYELYNEIEKTKELMRLQRHSKQSSLPDLTNKDVLKSTGYLLILEERRKAGDPKAAFYFGLHEMQICMVLNENKELAHTSNKVCSDAIDSFKIAAEANDPRSMRAIGISFKEGLGVTTSKYVAAEWFVRSAKQYNVEHLRDNALSALEEALNLVPDHPSALELRKELIR